MIDLTRRHPLVTYYVLAVAISTGLGLLLNVSLVFGLLALFGPAVAAVVAARLAADGAGVRAIRIRTTRWRVRPIFYLAAIGLPFVAYGIGLAAYVLLGNRAPDVPGGVTIVGLVLFVLVIGEEIGWRGFMLPILLGRMSPLLASGVTGVAWALWLRTRSVIIATVAHGSANLVSGLVLPVEEPGLRFVFSALGFGVVAVVLVFASRREFLASPPQRSATDGVIVEPALTEGAPA
jgi:membrane protease YdiL (CAAX protease family)